MFFFLSQESSNIFSSANRKRKTESAKRTAKTTFLGHFSGMFFAQSFIYLFLSPFHGRIKQKNASRQE
jgi:hypothetical protein